MRPAARGFSLLEVLIAISLLAIGALFVLGLFLSLASTVDNDGNRLQVSHFLESYHGELMTKTEAEWLAMLGHTTTQTRNWNGLEIRVETEVARLSNDDTQPDYRVFLFRSVAYWNRKRIEGGTGGQESRLEFFSQGTPTGRY